MPTEASAIPAIQASYESFVRPIFEKKCFDCHNSADRERPWYAVLPGVKQLIESDISDARDEFDMHEFPFNGAGSLKKDLKEILKEIEKEDMPPSLYQLMHTESKLTAQEIAAVKNWVELGLKELSH